MFSCTKFIVPVQVHFINKDLMVNEHCFIALFTYFRQCNSGNHMLYGKTLVVSVFGVPPFVFFNSDQTKVLYINAIMPDLIEKNNVDLSNIDVWCGCRSHQYHCIQTTLQIEVSAGV